MSIKADFSYKHKTKAILYLVPTPIGNIKDVTVRAQEILLNADIISCEDTRHTGELLSRLNIKNKKLISCYSQTEVESAEKIIAKMQAEDLVVAYCSDAGSPGISDPGGILATLAIKNDIPVSSLPGPTAFVPALTSSGFNTSSFTFVGFLPVKDRAKTVALEQYKNRTETLIFYEAPHRLNETLATMKKVFGPSRRACLGRELSKLYEQYIRGTFQDLSNLDEELIRGEFVIVVEGQNADSSVSDEIIIKMIREELDSGKSISEVSRLIAENTGLRKNYVYKLATTIKESS